MEGIIWRPGIGDPTVIGWITAIGYMLSSFLCARKARGLKIDTLKAEILKSEILTAGRLKSEMLKAQSLKDERLVWSGLAAVLFFLGLNKQLDFQTLLVEAGRDLAVSGGWLVYRRKIQAVLAVVGIVAGGLGLVAVGWRQWRFFRRNPLTILGLALLGLYFSLRILAVEHVGESVGMDIPDEAWWLSTLELAGTGFVSYAAFKK